jgi:hypothetical protein
VDEFTARCYAFLCSEDALDLGKTLGMVDALGAAGVKGMQLLDHGEGGSSGVWPPGADACELHAAGLPCGSRCPISPVSVKPAVNAHQAVPAASLSCLLAGHTSKFGHPEPTQVRITPKLGKAVLIR